MCCSISNHTGGPSLHFPLHNLPPEIASGASPVLRSPHRCTRALAGWEVYLRRKSRRGRGTLILSSVLVILWAVSPGRPAVLGNAASLQCSGGGAHADVLYVEPIPQRCLLQRLCYGSLAVRLDWCRSEQTL